jgi:predicted permease
MPEFRSVVRWRLGPLRLRPEREAEIIDELATQLQDCYEEALRAGSSPELAERVALDQFGNAWEQMAQEIEQADASPRPLPDVSARGSWLSSVFNDLRYAVRQCGRKPALTLLAVSTLALAIGANTAIYSVVHAALIQPLPYPQGERMVSIDTVKPSSPETEAWSSLPDFQDLRARFKNVELVSAVGPVWNHTLMFESAEVAEGLSVSASFAELTRIRMVAGRFFTAQEDRAGGERVAAISSALATTRFGSPQAALGKPLKVDGFTYTVVGVVDSSFEWLGEPVAASASKIDLWTPISTSLLAERGRSVRWVRPVARLRDGTSLKTASEELSALASALSAQYPESNAGFGMRLRPLKEAVVGTSRTPLLFLMAMVGFVLLIACGNVANLMLARAMERNREIAVRVAMGASSTRLAQQTLVESGLLAMLGGGAGMLLAALLVRYVIPAYGSVIPRQEDVAINWMAFAFSGGVTMLSALLTGTAPLWYMLRTAPAGSLRDGDRTATSRHAIRDTLVTAQLAFSLILLTLAGLLALSLQRLLDVDPGFAASEVATLSLKVPMPMAPELRYATAKRLGELAMRGPGVENVGFASRIPMMGQNISSWLWVEGRNQTVATVPEVEYRVVSDSYFATMGIPLKSGRLFHSSDERRAAELVVVNEAVAERVFPGENPIGKRVRFTEATTGPWSTIIGVVGNVRHFGLDVAPRPEIYRPYAVNPLTAPILVVRASDPAAAVGQIAAMIRSEQPTVAAHDALVMQKLVDRSALRRKLPAVIAMSFAGLALGIAAVGLAGITMNSVRQRRREFGVRMALGATVHDVVGLVIRDHFRAVLIGTALGLGGAVVLARYLRSMLYATSPYDPSVWIGAPLLLASIAAIACWIPARRTASIDPAETLRSE